MTGRSLTYFQGQWLEGNPGLLGPRSHAMWLSSVVFDGARAFEGVTPDLDLHCERVIRSAKELGLGPCVTAGEILTMAEHGVAQFPKDSELYIRPMFWAEEGFVAPDPETTQFALSVYESPLPDPKGGAACISGRRRPGPEVAPTSAKASCLYPQSGLALKDARERGFDNAIMLDMLGNVAEFATSNIMIAKEGVVATPAPNGTFLNGITRQRVIGLLRADGVTVEERRVTVEDVLTADEVFSTGNHGKVLPYVRVEDRDLQPGPLYTRARKLYWDYAHSA
ncbi:branched-chain amino acid aminotransferase [Inquilinus sp. CAU 1745]|uniref:branched-chain amino acid aminotransferase n=1 Tax=Inquilinus sp. CAU 1745 TaxID=3140369 RepID=UPI00325AD013